MLPPFFFHSTMNYIADIKLSCVSHTFSCSSSTNRLGTMTNLLLTLEKIDFQHLMSTDHDLVLSVSVACLGYTNGSEWHLCGPWPQSSDVVYSQNAVTHRLLSMTHEWGIVKDEKSNYLIQLISVWQCLKKQRHQSAFVFCGSTLIGKWTRAWLLGWQASVHHGCV